MATRTFEKKFEQQPDMAKYIGDYAGMFGQIGKAHFACFSFGGQFNKRTGKYVATLTLSPWKKVMPLGSTADFEKMAAESKEV